MQIFTSIKIANLQFICIFFYSHSVYSPKLPMLNIIIEGWIRTSWNVNLPFFLLFFVGCKKILKKVYSASVKKSCLIFEFIPWYTQAVQKVYPVARKKANSTLYVSCKLDFHYHFSYLPFYCCNHFPSARRYVMKFSIFVCLVLLLS